MQMFYRQPQLQAQQAHILDTTSSEIDSLHPQGPQGVEHKADFGDVIFPAGGSIHADKYIKQQVSAQTALLLRLPPKERASCACTCTGNCMQSAVRAAAQPFPRAYRRMRLR